jgi:hypothetical protein
MQSLFPTAPAIAPLRRRATAAHKQQHAISRATTRRQEKANDKRRWKCEHEHYEPPIPTPEETKFRHSHWQEKREKVTAALAAVNASTSSQAAFQCCGAAVTIEWSPSEKRYRCRGSYCHSRHCEPCMRQKANIMARNLQTKIGDNPDQSYRFLTFTLRHGPSDELAPMIKRLIAAWRKLRATDLWHHGEHAADKLLKTNRKKISRAEVLRTHGSRGQTGGCAIIEVKWSKAGGWHPHLHIISEGSWCDAAALSAAWLKITGDSFAVDIRQLHDAKGAAFYLGKYVKKGSNNEIWDDESARNEWLTATKGVRTAATFGSWRGFALTTFVPTTTDWKPIATLTAVHNAAANGDEWALSIMMNLTPSSNPEEVRERYLDGEYRNTCQTGDG